MVDKKKIVAIIIFVFFGLFMFAFANPNEDDLKPVNPNNNTNNGENNNNNNENKDDKIVVALPKITLGVNPDTIEVFSEIPEFNATATNKGIIKFTHKINNNVVGTYVVTATATNEAGKDTKTFNFYVVDTTKPVITLNGEEVTIRKNDEYQDQGAKAIDNYDGNITDKIIVTNNLKNVKGSYLVNYDVTDANNNKADTVSRKVNVTDADELEKAIGEAKEILSNNYDNAREDLKELLKELEEENKKGTRLDKDHESNQEDINKETEKINEIIEKIKNLKFTIKYFDYNKKLIRKYEIKYYETAMVPLSPFRMGYTFTGWDKEAVRVINDMNIYATYKINSYKLNITSDEGIYDVRVNGKANNGSYNYASSIIITYKVKAGYSDTSRIFNVFFMPAMDVNINLTSKLNTYFITYTLNGGKLEKSNPSKYTVKDTFTLNNPVRDGYTFTGWSLGWVKLGTNVEVSNEIGNKNYVANWKANTDTKYTVLHYQEELNGKYTLVDTDNLTGTTDTDTKAKANKYVGFTANYFKQSKISGKGDTVVKIYYTRNEYKLNIKTTNAFKNVKVNGKKATIKNVKFGSNVTITYDVKAGYTDTTDKTSLTFDMPAANKTVTLSSELISYNLTYILNGGEATNPATYTVEDKVVLNNPTKAGYTFTGWKVDNSTKLVKNVVLANTIGDHSFEATYKANTDTEYTIKYYFEDLQGILMFAKSETGKGTTDTFTNVTAPAVEGYDLVDIDQKRIKGDGSTIVYVKYMRQTKKVTYKYAEKDAETDTYKYETELSLRGEDTKSADAQYTYSFDGWYDVVTGEKAVDGIKVTSDMTFESRFEKTTNSYTVTYMNGKEKITDDTVKYGAKVDEAIQPTKNSTKEYNYTFAGWSLEENGELISEDFTITNDTILYAQYNASKVKYTISFDGEIAELENGAIISYPTNPTKENYTFKGWYEGNKEFTETIMPTRNVTLTSKFEQNTFSVSYFDENGKLFTTDSKVKAGEFKLDKKYNPTPNTAQYTYTFKGWSLEENGNVVGKINLTCDVKVYAIVEKTTNVYTVKFVNSITKETIKEDKVEYGKDAKAPEKGPKLDVKDYTFTGWDKDFTNVQGNLIVNALYTANQTGIRAELKDNKQMQFKKDSKPDLKDYINVYAVYADGSEKLIYDYITNLNTKEVTNGHKKLRIESGKYKDETLNYSVINEEAFSTKFEVIDNDQNWYYKTIREYCNNGNCDKGDNVRKVDTDNKILEIVEHYDENIEVKSVDVTYTDGTKLNGSLSGHVRYSTYKNSAFYNPVYILENKDTERVYVGYSLFDWDGYEYKHKSVQPDGKVIDTVVITYHRDGHGDYKIYFKYNASTKKFTAYDEVKI